MLVEVDAVVGSGQFHRGSSCCKEQLPVISASLNDTDLNQVAVDTLPLLSARRNS